MSQRGGKRPTLLIATGGAMTALVFIFTYFIKIPAPSIGYIHLGDGIIFLAGAVMGPFAAVCAGLGSALADVAGGYAIYVLPTFIIKAAMGVVGGVMLRGANGMKRLLALILAEIIMIVGYALAETIMYGGAAAIAAIPMNIIQGAAGVLLGLPLCELGERLKRWLY